MDEHDYNPVTFSVYTHVKGGCMKDSEFWAVADAELVVIGSKKLINIGSKEGILTRLATGRTNGMRHIKIIDELKRKRKMLTLTAMGEGAGMFGDVDNDEIELWDRGMPKRFKQWKEGAGQGVVVEIAVPPALDLPGRMVAVER